MLGGKMSEITHLIWATMSAVVDVPSMDCVLVNELGLNANVQRLAVQQMGCLSGFRYYHYYPGLHVCICSRPEFPTHRDDKARGVLACA